MIYSLDEAMVFDPFELDESVTPENIVKLVKKKYLTRALLVRRSSEAKALLVIFTVLTDCFVPLLWWASDGLALE